jgi:hypothetical protein
MQELVRYWGADSDLRRFEARLNALPRFITEINGLDIHFLHVQSPARARVAAHYHPQLARLGHRADRART